MHSKQKIYSEVYLHNKFEATLKSYIIYNKVEN